MNLLKCLPREFFRLNRGVCTLGLFITAGTCAHMTLRVWVNGFHGVEHTPQHNLPWLAPFITTNVVFREKKCFSGVRKVSLVLMLLVWIFVRHRLNLSILKKYGEGNVQKPYKKIWKQKHTFRIERSLLHCHKQQTDLDMGNIKYSVWIELMLISWFIKQFQFFMLLNSFQALSFLNWLIFSINKSTSIWQ